VAGQFIEATVARYLVPRYKTADFVACPWWTKSRPTGDADMRLEQSLSVVNLNVGLREPSWCNSDF
jgi:hypothetical protein